MQRMLGLNVRLVRENIAILVCQCVHFYTLIVDSSYQKGDIRLVGGSYNWEGRAEIYWLESWSTISNTSWTQSETRVVCKQLGHSTVGI